MSWRDPGRWSDDDPGRRLGGPGGDWRGLRPTLDNPMTWSVWNIREGLMVLYSLRGRRT